MVLLRKLFFRELVKYGHLLSKNLSHCETLRHKHVLANKEKVRLDHRDRTEESLEVVG
jgi:hypothetical protein